MLTDEDGHTAGEKRLGEPWVNGAYPPQMGQTSRSPSFSYSVRLSSGARGTRPLPNCRRVAFAPAEAVPTGVK